MEGSANKFINKSKSKIVEAQKILGGLYKAKNI